MAVPKKRTTRSRQGTRRSHSALNAPGLTVCPNCGKPKFAHRVCPHCGFYRGSKI